MIVIDDLVVGNVYGLARTVLPFEKKYSYTFFLQDIWLVSISEKVKKQLYFCYHLYS